MQNVKLNLLRFVRSVLGCGASFIVYCSLFCIPFGSSLWAQTDNTEFTEQQLEFFENNVRPLLVNHCFECHGPDAAPLEGGLSLASREDILEGGDTGAAIVPHSADESLLIQSVTYEDLYEMPPSGKLPDEKIEMLKKWVEMGAPWPNEAKNESTPKREVFDLAQRKKEHWSWVAPKEIPPKKPNGQIRWPKNPIDQYIVEKLAREGLVAVGAADKQTLIRRMTFDLTGIAPTPQEVSDFIADSSENATEKLIDRLLQSPRFGEHWARHWLDLMRYAETCGHEFDYPIPHAYQYRDYVIRAFNQDVPYDQFVKEHIAGDLIENPRRHPSKLYNESILGTGMWYLGEDVHAPVDVRAHLASRIDNQIDVLTKSFLGLTVACARCHDHKFDAISTEDFYSLAGYIKSSRRQLAMLDPDNSIKNSWNQISDKLNNADQLVSQYLSAVQENQGGQFADYFAAALEAMAVDKSWKDEAPSTLQGESFKSPKPKNGIVEVQSIAANGNFKWDGDKQLWWRDGKINDQWSIRFKNPFPTQILVDGVLQLTVARDYGKAKFKLNGQDLGAADCFQTTLGTTQLEFKNIQLRKTNTLEVTLQEPNPKAIPRNMMGIDFVRLSPTTSNPESWTKKLRSIATNRELDFERLEKLTRALQAVSKKPSRLFQPLRDWTTTASLRELISKSKSVIGNQKATRKRKMTQLGKETRLYADLSDGLPKNWTTAGYAFEMALQPHYSIAQKSLGSAGYASSGRYGKKFRGVLRTPTFELSDDTIHFRVRGENFRIRLVVENFRMDDYNPLLFRGLQIRQKSVPDFKWLTMRGDLKLQLGNRAFIEFLDEGDGWIEVEKVAFGKKAPAEKTTEFTGLIAELDEDQSTEVLTSQFAEKIKDWLVDPKFNNEKIEFLNWLQANQLSQLLVETQSKISLDLRPAKSPQLRELERELDQAKLELRSLASTVKPPILAQAMADGNGEDEFIFVRGNHKNLGKVAPRKFLTALDSAGESIREAKASPGSGRASLANRIATSENPLTSRVIVNRIWHHLMGRGIVESTDNFGVLGKPPTHPELLDHLAVEMVKDGWSMKRMIKRILLTEAYQRKSSNPDKTALELDPDNRLLHRANIKRLSGESIRDTLLAVSGRLDSKMYGPSIPVHVTPFMQGRGRPRSGPLDGQGRRSIYIAVRRNFLSPMMLAFDTPIPFNSIGRRNRSNVPAQALILMNDPLVTNLAQEWAKKLIEYSPTPENRIRFAYQAAFSRAPSDAEVTRSLEFLERQAQSLEVDTAQMVSDVRIWRDYCHVLFNVKDFIYIH